MKNVLPGKMTNRFILFMAIFGLCVFFRLFDLTSDTPLWHMYTDEGWKNMDARRYTLSGDWTAEPFVFPYYLYMFPVFTLSQAAVFMFFGIGYVQARIVPVAFGIFSLVLIFKILRRSRSFQFGLLGILFLGLSWFFTQFNRTAVAESQVIFIMLLSLFFFIKGEKKIGWFLSGFFLFVAVIAKLNAIILLPCFIITIIFKSWQNSESNSTSVTLWWWLFGFCGGILGFVMVWQLFQGTEGLIQIIKLNYNQILESINWRSGHAGLDFSLRNTHLFPQTTILYISDGFMWLLVRLNNRLVLLNRFFTTCPALSLASGLYFLWVFSKKRRWSEISIPELFSGLWLILGLLMLGLTKFTSYHYSVIIVPALVVLSAGFFLRVREGVVFFTTRGIELCFFMLIFIFVVQQTFFSLLMWLGKDWLTTFDVSGTLNVQIETAVKRVIFETRDDLLSQLTFLQIVQLFQLVINGASLIGALIFTGYIFWYFRRQRLKEKPKIKIRRNAVIFTKFFLISFFLIYNGSRFFHWQKNIKYTQVNTSQDLGKQVRKNQVISGGEFLLLENGINFIHHHVGSGASGEKIDYVFQMIYHPLYGKLDLTMFWRKFPNARLVKQYKVDYFIYNLYRVNGINLKN